jgi:hypothetical protein
MDGRHNKNIGCSVIIVAIQTIVRKCMVSTFDLLAERKRKQSMKVLQMLCTRITHMIPL